MALSSSYSDQTHKNASKSMQSNLSRFETSGEFDTPEIAVETIDGIERFEELEAVWNELFARAAEPKNVFQSFNWHWHWARHYLKKDDQSLRIVAVWCGDDLIMVWPLVMTTALGVRQLKWMGAPVSQYGDILVDRKFASAEIIEPVWQYIARHIKTDVISLEKVRADAQIAPLLKAGKSVVTGCMDAPYLDLASAENYAEYEKRYSSKARKNRRRHRRRLGEQGDVQCSILETGEDARATVAEAIALKRDWLKAKGLVSRAYSDTRFDAFFADVAGSTDHPCGCLISVLKCGSEAVAYDIGFKAGTNYVVHIGAYNHEYEKVSPGSLLTEDFLNECYDLDIETYDLMAPSASYKMSWADDCVSLCDYAYPLNTRGFLYAKGILWFLRNAIKKTLKHTPVKLLQTMRPVFRLAGL